jgi:hypothetical protein
VLIVATRDERAYIRMKTDRIMNIDKNLDQPPPLLLALGLLKVPDLDQGHFHLEIFMMTNRHLYVYGEGKNSIHYQEK